MDPHKDSKIRLNPGRIIWARIVGVNMAEKIEPAKDDR
jgi:hypothetical protein